MGQSICPNSRPVKRQGPRQRPAFYPLQVESKWVRSPSKQVLPKRTQVEYSITRQVMAQGRQAPSLTSQNERATKRAPPFPAGGGWAINPRQEQAVCQPASRLRSARLFHASRHRVLPVASSAPRRAKKPSSLCQGAGGHAGGARCRRAFMLPCMKRLAVSSRGVCLLVLGSHRHC